MSFTSDYLKLRAARESNSENYAGDAKSPASSEITSFRSSDDSFTSGYLALREKRESMSISERAEERARLLKQNQPGRIYSNRKDLLNSNSSGGYYSPPTFGSAGEKIYDQITKLEPVLTEKRSALDAAQTSLAQSTSDLQTVRKYLDQALVAYHSAPSEANANNYNQIAGAYNVAYDAYSSAFKAYSAAYDDYKPYEEEAINALALYRLYGDNQQEIFDHWRGTIRDVKTIQNDIAAIDQKIVEQKAAEKAAAEITQKENLAQYEARQREKPWYEKLLGYLGETQDTSLPMAGITPGTVESAYDDRWKSPSQEMQSLLDTKKLLQEELDWSQYYYYADHAAADDFEEMSKYVPQERKKRRALDLMMDNYSDDASGWEDPLYEYINGNEEAGAYLSNAGANYYGSDNALGSIFGRVADSKSESQQMKEPEIAIFNYLYATQGKAAAHAYYDYLQRDLNYRQREADEKKWKTYATEHPVASSVFSVAVSPLKGMSYIGQLADMTTTGTIDENAAYNRFSYIPGAIRGQVVEQMEAKGNWGKVGSFAYQTGLSMADFLLTSALTGGNQAAALTIMGSGAAADTVIAAKDRRLNDAQAFTLGTIAGIAEAAMESMNMETVFKPDLLKEGILKYILKNGAAEGMEEVGTDVVNLVADVLISKDQSEWQASIDYYMRQDMTEAEAIAKALGDQALTMALDAGGGFLSGSIMSGYTAVINAKNTKKIGKELDKLDLDESDIQAFIETGLESDPDSASYYLAKEMQAKIEAGEPLSNNDLARLYQANVQAIQAEEETTEDLPDDIIIGDDQTATVAEDVAEPSGLQLPSLEADTQNGQVDTTNLQNVTPTQANVTPTQANDTVLPAGVPLSVADQLRLEQAQNGGAQYESAQRTTTGPAVAQPAGGLHLPGRTGVSDGGTQWNVGASTAEQTGILAGSPEQRRSAWAERSRATVARQNYARSLRLEKVSSLDLGLKNGTEVRNIQIVPQEYWDSEMVQLDNRIYNETGKHITYVMGRIQIRGTGGTVGYARGVITGDRIIVQADHLRIPMEQIADHEAYHAKVDFTDGRLNDEIRRHIVETFSEEQFRQVLDKYIVGLRGVIDVNETHTGAEFEAAVRQIEEEIFADAYAGINAFSAGADQFTGAVNEKMDQLYMGKIRNQDNGTEEPTGPPSDRYSFAGENANNADLDALARAKEMQAAGVADETIRQQTGWHTGMDGKWRWEIDDSTMRYDSSGDLRGAESAKWAMEDYESARDDLWGHADMGTLEKVRAYNRADIAGDDATKQELYDELINGQYAYYFDQYVEAMTRAQGARNAPAGGTLQDYIDHPALFEAYPQLRNVTLRFERMGGGMMGYYSRTDNEIVLNTELRYAAEDTLVHEIQHAIQKAEGFTRGSNEEYWKQRQDGDDAVHVYDAKIQESEKKMDEIMRQLPENVAEQFRQWSAMDESSPEAMALMQELWGSPYNDLFEDYWFLNFGLDDMRRTNHKRGYRDLYRNTAGEIEARDVTARRSLTSDQRRSQEPARGDSYTVFMEDSDELSLQMGDRYSADDVDSHGHSLTPEQQEFYAQSQARDSSGRLLVLYHQTDGDFTIFDTRHPGAGSRDSDTPFGIFLKQTAGDIGLAGKKQMALYANITNPLRAANREDLARQLREISGSYASISDKHKQLDAQYHEKFEQAKKAWRDYIIEWRAANPGANRSALNDDPKFNELFDAEDAVVDEWTAAADLLSTQAKEAITEDLRKAGYDGVFLENDVGSWGRRTDAIIALDPQQVKNISNKMPTSNPDIRYSVDDADDQVTIGDLQAELYQLQHQRRSLLEADTAYAAAADNLRYANTFTEKVAARKAMAAAAANINTAAIDQRISDLNEQISEIRNRETRKHREDQEKYSGTKTAGYSTMPDTRLKDLDQDYMKAVRSGDRTRMAELVEQAAEAAMPASVIRDKSGRLLKTYHHTGNRFTVFDRNMARTGTEMDGFFFAPDPDSTSEYGSNMITAYLNITKLAMDPKLDRKFNDSGTLLREKLAYQGYDGMARTENGEIYEYMTFDPEQIKSADPVVYDDRGRVVPLSERFNFHNPDIRYSVDDEGSQESQEQKPAAPKKKIRPVAESRPLIAKKDLRSTVLNLFSIPNGQRAEVGAMIDSYADRLIKNGSLTEDDRKTFFDRMYDAGVMVMPAEEYSAFARSHIVDGRIYVSDSVKSDFGDDWADIRRRAFAAGVYLVNDRSASGIDQWNATLSAEDMLPGLFDSEETDERTILERILQVAEEGKDEHLSLAEYTRRLSQQEGISEDEFLDNMERQLDWALRTFAEKARLEVHLRDRTGRKIAQEREKGAERMTRQQAKEAQRRADERQARKDSARRAKERRELRELQQRTLKQLQWLSKNRNRAPEELQATWDEVLGDIDLYAISAADEMRWSDKHNATWKDLVEMYDKAKAEDPNFFESKELERFVARLRYKKLEDLDIDALDALYKLATGLRTKFYNQKNVINDEMQRLFAEVYTDSKREIESAPGENSAKKGKVSGWADKFLNMDQLTPMNVLQRMAGWDPDGAFYSMAKQLERGERDMRAYSVKAQKMLQDFLTEHEDWVKKADGQGKDGLWYKIEIPELVALELGKTPQFGGTIEVWMTPMQKIHMYLESKNQDNLRHMTGGRTFADKQIYSEGKRQEAFAQGKTVRMAPETVKAIVKDLTAEEMELAQILDRYYNTFATQEINKVSNILYGYDKAMGKNYAPIYTNRNYTKTEFGVFDTTAEGVGNLKGRQYAVNPSYNISAFDAFERHVDQTARFCGMAIPARNWTNLMNWREKNNSTGDVITHKWGEEGKRYITDLITTLQAGDDAKSESVSTLASRLQSNYISAVFGANPSIVLKQLGSIPLAGAYLDARNMPTPAQISKIDRSLISKYTQELEWRTMGYATPETKQLKDNPNWTQTNKAFKFVFGGGAITAMDGWAASTLWPWAENKVRREHPELAVGTKAQIDAGESAFYKKVAEEFEIAVSRSQSVSDEIHQGTLRKSKNPITKAFTMFRSDSAQTYNALRQKIGEARYYMRTGAKEKVIQTAKKAAGTAFVAMLLNAAWSEAVSFLMALWKNKGKYYRDDEDELTFLSVAGEMVSNMLGSFAGVVTFGEEVFEIIGNILTGEKIYDIETPGMEQLNDLIDAVTTAGGGMRELVAGGWDVLKNGGNLGDYFSKHSGEMLGGIKDLAEAAAVYLSGMPASNLEAYLIGALKWVSPELGAAYDDLFSDTGKSDLAGMEGDALEGRVGRIPSDRNVSESDDTAAALAALYEGGYKTAIPSDTPTSVSIDGEKHSLGEYQQQAYDTIWGGIVADALDDMVASDSFKEADQKTQAKMLSNLYTYAAEQAKAELFDEYELDSGAAKNAAIVAAGATVAECITWNTITSEMKSGEKSAELASWDIPEEAKREIFRCKISDSREDSIAAFDEAGLSFDQFLQAYSMYGQINNEDLKAGMKAVEFSHWVNAQGYTAEQAAVVKDELTYFNMTPASSSRYDELVGAGMDPDEAYDLTGALNELQPEDGADEVSDLQKWRASVDFSDDVEDQLAALSAVMTDAQFQKVEIANNFGVSPDAYVTLQEIKSQYDADGNGSYKNAEIQAAVDGLPGYYTTEQKAVLWQLATGSTSARNNPYSRQVGQQVLDARAAAKEAAAQEQTEAPPDSTDDDSFSQALLDQLLGRG